jgi:hypothetical protein
MKIEAASSFSPLYYFLAGALLPTIAYAFLQRNSKDTPTFEFDEADDSVDEFQSSSEEDAFEPIDKSSVDPSKWGITDAPYKVRFDYYWI